MRVNQFAITANMSIVKSDLPEFTWDDIVRCGLAFCRIMANDDNTRKYKQLYHLSKKSVKELITYNK